MLKATGDNNKDAGYSFSGGVQIQWENGDDVKFNGYVQGEVHDDKGNSADMRYQQGSDGTKSVDFSVHHDDKNSDQH
jgi:major membrane immunogen (membrane-anchored lipoprotein)